jgi:hypothetical protein
MLRAAVEAVDAAEDTDAALDPGAPAIVAAEPALLFVCPAGKGRRSSVGQGDAPDAGLDGVAADGGRRAATITGEQIWRSAELATVTRDSGHDVRGIGRGTIEDVDIADDPTVDFGQPELAAELHRLPVLMARDDGGVGLHQVHHLLGGGHGLASEHAPLGLVDDAARQRHQTLELTRRTLGSRVLLRAVGRLGYQCGSDALGLTDDGPGDATEPGIRSLSVSLGTGALASR